ncbi:winged helix-turn-helix transcriptional regulator [Tessaracoccus rhinocerotis]|uniref:Winged helix-turn-helix transcriptional regulator n=1 Tax=Tessaracoccus rhinocerotis TaxID=1689449 RepID=A0A553JXD6_9ACTN|nr:metalloregulator ArsR/SmtB family transcription factor [Tessaracoccus rhinocerotis]TRY17118.1 winged helix-turn-helix transcriptional regulator [Tessaracoccus rhinocerotis]
MDTFAAIADPVRRALLLRLSRGPARVVDLAGDHAVSRPAISKHLRVLATAGLVEADDVGRERHYRLVTDGLEPVRALLESLTTTSTPRIPEHTLDRLDLEVRRAGHDRERAPSTATHEHKETG